ncbi:sugar transporter [Iodidimonas gelatinilytica]|uniref:Sugar transporter n=1 Tax=Iodidimonas gelatinilytica TaxID=1236966 RepID=A0A5A7N2L4_9PROT|nr:SLBB domain-containing protein [Iodidimonas gelatinilytica]GER01339.1 sugar transporter [Iodidimonas gelatinilytica]
MTSGWAKASFFSMRTVWVVFIFGIMMFAFGSAKAQLPDPETLSRLLEQGQALQSSIGQTQSPLDRSRDSRSSSNLFGFQDEFAEEKEDPLSPIEADYNRRLGRELPPEPDGSLLPFMGSSTAIVPATTIPTATAMTPVARPPTEEEKKRLNEQREAEKLALEKPVLRQFGYDIFRENMAADGPVTGRLSDSYVLGVGDEIVVSLAGQTKSSIITSVDREGRVVIPDLAPIPAAGRQFGDFSVDLQRRVSETLLGTDAYVSVGALRQISVTVVGEVTYPGVYQATSQSDALQVLALAGGIKKTGSLRKIAIFRDGKRRSIDLYDVLFGSADVSLDIRDGDRLFVPLVGDTIAIASDVVRPAIYELLPDMQLTSADVLALAGGSLRPRGYSIERNRIGANGQQHIAPTAPEDPVLPGDLLQVFPKREVQIGQVRLDGHVRQPGLKPLASVPTISKLLMGGDALQPAPYLLFAILETTDEVSRQRIYQPVDLGPILSGIEDIALKEQDALLVMGPEEMAYLSSEAVRSAILSPESVTSDQCKAITSLARRARQADSERLAAVARSVFVVTGAEQGGNDSSGGASEQQMVEEASNFSSDEIVSSAELARLASQDADCNDFFEESPEVLPLAIEYSVVMMGAVREPGLYPIANTASLRDLVATSGGMSLSVDPSQIEISSFRGGDLAALGAVERRYIDSRTTALSEIQVTPGSAIRFASLSGSLEAGTVLLSGEFRRPGVYSIKRGETLMEVMERAGGLTEQAYPFGAVFTRVRVKQEQQESFRRTARELNNALALAMVQNNISGNALTAASGLVNSFAMVEAAGRVVVEADPRVLQQEPDRDLVLEGGDSIFMPKRPNFVLTAGDLLNPGALQFRPGKTLEDYLGEAGGFQETADKGRVFIVFPNGVAQPVTMSRWSRSSVMVPPGSTIVVPKDVNPLQTLNIVREIAGVLSNLAVSAASIAVISR